MFQHLCRNLLELELTESATMQNLERSKRILGQLVDLGVRTGDRSLHRMVLERHLEDLRRLPLRL